MEFVGVTRLVDGKETAQFVARCPEHNFYYKGNPPITHGCRECWAVFYVTQWLLNGGKKEDVDNLEEIINHVAEVVDKGEWDFKPEFDIQIEKEN